uniref:Uncharacterized protein n=1 Tax=Arundo donax TaxID=35708 RepID=A0A0A9GKK8_ARUDO
MYLFCFSPKSYLRIPYVVLQMLAIKNYKSTLRHDRSVHIGASTFPLKLQVE